MAAISPRVTQIISLLDACTPEEYGAVQQYMTAHPPVEEEHTLEESIPPAAIERALEDDVLRVSAELQQPGEGGESPMLEVQIMAITGDVFPVQVSRDDTVRNRCRQQQDMNYSCVDQGVVLEQQAKLAMKANGRVELFFEGNPVSPGEGMDGRVLAAAAEASRNMSCDLWWQVRCRTVASSMALLLMQWWW